MTPIDIDFVLSLSAYLLSPLLPLFSAAVGAVILIALVMFFINRSS